MEMSVRLESIERLKNIPIVERGLDVTKAMYEGIKVSQNIYNRTSFLGWCIIIIILLKNLL